MKSFCLLLSTTAAVSLLSAPAFAADKSAFNGSYAGVQAGYVNNHIEDKFTGAGSSSAYSYKQDSGVSGFDGGLFAGYGKTINQFYLGAEAEGSLSNADSRYSDTTFSSKTENSGSYGASLRAGFFPKDDLLVYGRLGAVRGKFDYSERVTTGSTSAKKDEWLDGLRTGLGAEASIAQNLTARADWAYTNYEDMTVRQPGGNGTSKLSPNANTFRVGVAYHFQFSVIHFLQKGGDIASLFLWIYYRQKPREIRFVLLQTASSELQKYEERKGGLQRDREE